jgi:hypothetical protein
MHISYETGTVARDRACPANSSDRGFARSELFVRCFIALGMKATWHKRKPTEGQGLLMEPAKVRPTNRKSRLS